MENKVKNFLGIEAEEIKVEETTHASLLDTPENILRAIKTIVPNLEKARPEDQLIIKCCAYSYYQKKEKSLKEFVKYVEKSGKLWSDLKKYEDNITSKEQHHLDDEEANLRLFFMERYFRQKDILNPLATLKLGLDDLAVEYLLRYMEWNAKDCQKYAKEILMIYKNKINQAETSNSKMELIIFPETLETLAYWPLLPKEDWEDVSTSEYMMIQNATQISWKMNEKIKVNNEFIAEYWKDTDGEQLRHWLDALIKLYQQKPQGMMTHQLIVYARKIRVDPISFKGIPDEILLIKGLSARPEAISEDQSADLILVAQEQGAGDNQKNSQQMTALGLLYSRARSEQTYIYLPDQMSTIQLFGGIGHSVSPELLYGSVVVTSKEQMLQIISEPQRASILMYQSEDPIPLRQALESDTGKRVIFMTKHYIDSVHCHNMRTKSQSYFVINNGEIPVYPSNLMVYTQQNIQHYSIRSRRNGQ